MLSGMVDTLMLSSVSDQAVGAVGTANTYISVFIIMFGVDVYKRQAQRGHIGARGVELFGEIGELCLVDILWIDTVIVYDRAQTRA